MTDLIAGCARSSFGVVATLSAALLASFLIAPFPGFARPAQGALDICDFDGPTDIANLGSPGGSFAVVADTGNNLVRVLGAGCSSFQLQDGDAAPNLDAPNGVAVDPDGRIYIADTGNDRILRFESIEGMNTTDIVDLQEVFSNPSTGLPLNDPEGLGADDNGLIYIANTGSQRVLRMDTAGFPQGNIGTPDNEDDDLEAGELVTPADVAVCSSDAPGDFAGRIFVADRGNDTVQVFDADGNPLFRFGDTGSAPGLFNNPRSIDVDPTCNVYVADSGNDRVQMFDGDGGFLEVLGTVPDAGGVAVAPFASGGIYASATGSDDVRSFEYINYDVDGNGNSDDDGDSLPDIWEENGIDIDYDGTVEFDLPGAGADPNRKNIFVEVDYLTFHLPDQDALDAVIDVFATAPVSNPDGSEGIDLIVDVDDEIDETPARANLTTWSEFDDLKGDFFGTAAERGLPNANDVLFAKLLAYRYALYGHIRDGGGSSGRAKGGGNFVVTLGANGWGADPSTGHRVGTFKQQAGTFMHELGHTLSLGHGGIDGENFKPNYLSVMNYNFQTAWVQNDSIPDGRLDYSSQRLPTFDDGELDENDLDETQGLGLGAVAIPDDVTRWLTPSGVTEFGNAGDPLNWDGVGGPTDTGTASELNTDGDFSVLSGQNDWDFLDQTPKAFNFRDSIGFAEFGQPLEDEEPELTDVEAREIEEFWETRGQYRFVYSAKFLCVPLVGPEGSALSPGRYQTVINVHNPSTEDVRFRKKAVIARNENEERGIISPLEPDTLADDEAMSIDCASIAARFDGPQPVGDGFVVIKSNEPLDVVAVYTSRDGVDVEQIEPVIFEDEDEPNGDPDDDPNDDPRRRADLTVDLPSQTRVDCPGGQGTCIHTVEVEISNIDAVDAMESFDVRVETDNGLFTVETFPGLAAGASLVFVAEMGPGNICYNPNCEVTATVDVNDDVPEADETNNVAVREDLG